MLKLSGREILKIFQCVRNAKWELNIQNPSRQIEDELDVVICSLVYWHQCFGDYKNICRVFHRFTCTQSYFSHKGLILSYGFSSPLWLGMDGQLYSVH